MPDRVARIHSAVSALAGACDRARERDDVGFNAGDAHIGHWLAATPSEDWSLELAAAAANMLRKYRRQLESAGFDHAEIVRFADETAESDHETERELLRDKANEAQSRAGRRIALSADGETVEASFTYRDPAFSDIRGEIQTVPGARWDAGAKVWRIPSDAATDVPRSLVERREFDIADDAMGTVSAMAEAARFSAGDYREPDGGAQAFRRVDIDGDTGEVAIKFPFAAAVKDDLKAALASGGPRWDGSAAVWRVSVERVDPLALDAFAERNGFAVNREVDRALEGRRAERVSEADAARAEYLAPDGVEPDPDRRVDLERGKLVFRFPPPTSGSLRALKETVKTAFGGRFDPSETVWRAGFGSDPEWTRRNLWELAGQYGLILHPEVDRALAREAGAREEAHAASSEVDAEFEVPDLGGELLPFQRAGAAYIALRKRVLLADEMGLGKTVQTLAAVEKNEAFPLVVVCPASAKLNWAKEVRKWLPHRSLSVLEGATDDAVLEAGENGRYDADVVILNYDILNAHLPELASRLGGRSVAFDESQNIKNREAKRSQAALELADGAEMRVLLSGTPFMNRPAELLTQLEAIDRLDDLGGFWQFAERYCAAKRTKYGWDLSGAANMDELNDRLRSVCYVRREKADVLAELPDKRETVVPLRIPAAERKKHERAKSDIARYTRELAVTREELERRFAHLPENDRQREIERHTSDRARAALRAKVLTSINACRQIAGQGKMKSAKTWIEDALGRGGKLIVFTVHNAPGKELAKHFRDKGFGVTAIVGDETSKRRQKAVETFQNDPECRLFVGSLDAAGTAITLTAASAVAFLEYGWKSTQHDQAADRAHRIGQKNALNVYYFEDETTIDAHMAEIISAKRQLIAQGVSGSETTSAMEVARSVLSAESGEDVALADLEDDGPEEDQAPSAPAAGM